MDKHVVLIVSGGRTGTTFLGDLLDTMIADAFSVHEPDVFAGLGRRTWKRILRFGFYHMVVGRILGRTGLRNLTRQYLGGELSVEELSRGIRKHRRDYYASLDRNLIIEANYQWYGVLPGVAEEFPSYRVVAVVRDPRPWVTSLLAQGERRGPGDRVLRWGFQRVEPRTVGDEEYAQRWREMSTFERTCWDWHHIYGVIDDWVSDDPESRLFLFEDLFLGDSRADAFQEMLDFITTFPDRSFGYDFDPALLDVRKNPSQHKATPAEVAEKWRSWPPERARALDGICGPLMRKLGYGEESTWRELVEGG